ncbi:MAG TPA: dihydroorotase family protein, partial [Planctomycetota bacterium]
NPSIKYAADRDGLIDLLAAGALAGVGTDHAPHPLSEKDRSYAKAPSGFPSVDLLLPLLVAAHDRFGLPLERALAAVTRDPAFEFGLARKGRLRTGADADLVVADPEGRRAVDETALPSRSKWSPYHCWQLRAFPDQVYLRGHLVFADGAVAAEARGRSLL